MFKIFQFRKKKNDEIKDEIQEPKVKSHCPKIIFFNSTEGDRKILDELSYNIDFHSYGHSVKLKNEPRRGSFCLVNHSIPTNVHEYDIFIIDMCNEIIKDYIPAEHQRAIIPSDTEDYIFCSYPQNIFNPLPLSGTILSQPLESMSNKSSILVIFANEYQKVTYELAHKTTRGAEVFNRMEAVTYSFYPSNIPFLKNKSGKIVKINESLPKNIYNILNKYSSFSEYHITFHQMTKWSETDGQRIDDINFLPFFYNDTGEIVSFGYINKKQWILVLPDIRDKARLVSDLINEYFPVVLPELFPDNKINAWKNESRYYLPRHSEYLDKLKDAEKEYLEKTNKIKEELNKNYCTYSFLYDILTETGEKLVEAVTKYLSYLGFSEIINMDVIYPGKNDEDIQIKLDDKLLIFEVKGIGGSPSDADCYQISKIRNRRCKERKDFNVDAIFLVNHQRHLPPFNRKTIPFSENQINDAKSDDRSLLTTLDLYKAFFFIEKGIFDKTDFQKLFAKKGLINIIEDFLIEIGTVEEIYKGGYVIILNLANNSMLVGDLLITGYNNQYNLIRVENIQINDKNVEFASNCEVGIKINTPIKHKAKLFRKRNQDI